MHPQDPFCTCSYANILEGGFAINDKSVSRKHLTIQVAEVAPGDAVRKLFAAHAIGTDTRT